MVIYHSSRLLDIAALTLDLPAVISAIIVAAGQGTRMKTSGDKLFLELAGRPVIAHSWGRLDKLGAIDEIVLVVREGAQEIFQDLAKQYDFQKPYRFANGGKERQDSVWNGLQALSPEAELVAIQDAARPCTSERVILDTLQAAREMGAAVAAQRLTDTIKESLDGRRISRHLDRSRLWSVQTPQTFRVAIIRKALAAVREKGMQVTDDTAACELIGQPVQLVESLTPNPKITLPSDVPYVEMLLQNSC